jgi:capsule polysaccharide export protein KpsE/RkpR
MHFIETVFIFTIIVYFGNYMDNKSNLSKALGHDDSSGFDFAQEMLHGDETFAINFDRIQKHPERGYIIFEYLRCHESQTVTPYTSHPNRYFYKNKHKFVSLFTISKDLNAELFLVNYAKSGTKHEDLIKVMKVLNIDEFNAESPVTTKDWLTNRKEFSDWFRKLNRECASS